MCLLFTVCIATCSRIRLFTVLCNTMSFIAENSKMLIDLSLSDIYDERAFWTKSELLRKSR